MKKDRKITLILPTKRQYRELAEALAGKLCELGGIVTTDTIEAGDKNAARIVSGYKDSDLLIVFDMAGFEAETLTGGISYNLLNCKQVHLLLSDLREKERFLEKPLSIAMFFYCADKETYDRLHAQYAQLPYLKQLEGFSSSEGNVFSREQVGSVMAAVSEVCSLCGL